MTPVCSTLKITRTCVFDYINTGHPNIRFMMERVFEKKLPFLDIMLQKDHSSFLLLYFARGPSLVFH